MTKEEGREEPVKREGREQVSFVSEAYLESKAIR